MLDVYLNCQFVHSLFAVARMVLVQSVVEWSELHILFLSFQYLTQSIYPVIDLIFSKDLGFYSCVAVIRIKFYTFENTSAACGSKRSREFIR